MDDNLIAYIEWIELETFFSGYLVIYAIFYLISSRNRDINKGSRLLVRKLPLAYALAGTLYCGLQLKYLYPDFHFTLLLSEVKFRYLKVWGLLSILFWLPALRKRPIFSQLHSAVFFFLLMKNIYAQLFNPVISNDTTGNNIKIFSVSMLINLASVIAVVLISILIERFKNRKRVTAL